MILGISMVLMFAVSPRVSPLLWFFLTSIGLFTTYSFLSINFYAQGVQKAKSISGNHKKVAAWRETGALLGVCLAASTPTLLMSQTTYPYMIFSFIFVSIVSSFLSTSFSTTPVTSLVIFCFIVSTWVTKSSTYCDNRTTSSWSVEFLAALL